MTYRLRLSREALDHLASIGNFLLAESGSGKVAARVVDRLIARCEGIAALPGTLGRSRPELRPDIRSLAFRSYVIFFRYIGDVLEVVAILEGHRDIETYFHDDEI